jgi:D-2-hydroxyacid dehydrogenase (NADP+)
MTVRVLVTGRAGPELFRAIREASPRVEIVTEEGLEVDPALLETVEVVYGGLGRDRFARARCVRWIQVTGAGVNGLLTPEVVASPVRITNASGIHAEPITEHFFGMLLTLTRRLNRAWDQQRAAHWESGPLRDQVGMLAGRTLGVLGVGAIGTHAARVGAAFGMRVLGLRRSPAPVPYVERVYGPAELEPFLGEADVVFDTLPLTPATTRLLDARAFAAMKPGAIIANVGRGGTIDTAALVEALNTGRQTAGRERSRAGRLGGALLDVTDPEPLPAGHPLWRMENVLITPHYSGNHPGYDERAARIFLENLRRYLAGEALLNEVDKAEGY